MSGKMPKQVWFFLRVQKAQSFGRPVGDGFLVRKGSTAMAEGSPNVKRNRHERDLLLETGILVADSDPDLFRFSQDHVFSSSSRAGGIIKDGNCSGPQSWKQETDGKTLREIVTKD
jgi:hypothetical protein